LRVVAGWAWLAPTTRSGAEETIVSYDAPFAGLKVVDLSQGIAGPYCGMLLAQNGADVIKIEPVEAGDWSRILGRVWGDHSAYSIAGNLGKRSLALDLKSDDGKAVLWRLLQDADVVIEGFRPGVTARLGFGYDAVAARNPRVLYLSISGFGQTGPLAERPAMDPILQAYSGLLGENRGEDGIPHRVPIIAIDMATALYAFQAVSAALYARRDAARGRWIETSLMQAAASLQVVRLMGTWLEDGAAPVAAVPGGTFKTADGWMQITVVQQRDWLSLCRAIDLPDLAADPRFADRTGRIAHQDALYAVLRPALAAMTTPDLDRRLADARIMHERVNSYLDFLAQPHVAQSGLIAWLTQAGLTRPAPMPNIPGLPGLVDGTARAASPTLGEHSRSVLLAHGYTDAQIADLMARGVVGAPALAETA
jgi:crotonobetainyl-CoA:carnitine CoA-transferase CaiB-like acyl-CoA transferase